MKIYNLKNIAEKQRLPFTTRLRLQPYTPGTENKIASPIDTFLFGKSTLDILTQSRRFPFGVGFLTENLTYDLAHTLQNFKLTNDEIHTNGYWFVKNNLDAIVINNPGKNSTIEIETGIANYGGLRTASIELSKINMFPMNSSMHISALWTNEIFWAAAEQEVLSLAQNKEIPSFYGKHLSIVERHTILRWLPFAKYLSEIFNYSSCEKDYSLRKYFLAEHQRGNEQLRLVNHQLGLEADNTTLFPFKPGLGFTFLQIAGLAGLSSNLTFRSDNPE